MSRKKSRKSGPPLALPPEVGTIDASWDELMGDGDPDPCERPTTVPAVSSETFAQQVMAEADRSQRAEDDFSSLLPPLGSEPPVLQTGEQKRSMSTVPPPRGSKGARRQRAVTRRDQPASRQKHASSQPKGAQAKQTPAEGTGLELQSISERPAAAPARRAGGGHELKDRYAMGDFSGALDVAEAILEKDPDDLDAQRYAQSCRDVLMQMYSERMGSLRQVARVAIPSDQIRWLSLDHRSGFLLSLVDGTSTIEEILDISGMQRLDALRILHALFEQRVISLGGDR
jgi:hypothetical protein